MRAPWRPRAHAARISGISPLAPLGVSAQEPVVCHIEVQDACLQSRSAQDAALLAVCIALWLGEVGSEALGRQVRNAVCRISVAARAALRQSLNLDAMRRGGDCW